MSILARRRYVGQECPTYVFRSDTARGSTGYWSPLFPHGLRLAYTSHRNKVPEISVALSQRRGAIVE